MGAELSLNVLSDERWSHEVAIRRLAAEVFVRPCLCLAGSSGRGLPASLHGSGINISPAEALPSSDQVLTAELQSKGTGGPEATIEPRSCALALRRRLEAWKSRLSSPMLPTVVETQVPMLSFDGNFESGSLGPVLRHSAREYEIRLLSDSAYSASHVQWFCFRVKGMQTGVAYTFHLSNLQKPGSLFEEGCQPVMYSLRRSQEVGLGWTREGQDVAYYPSDEQGRRLRVSFDVIFPYEDDEVFLAHTTPYTYSDLLRALAKWPDVPRKILSSSRAGREIFGLKLGDPSAQRSVVIVARAHPGETHASWVMWGILDFLMEGGEDAAACFNGLRWLIVPMLNPDGVASGFTRTTLDGIDLNRHHHDDSAPETRGLRAALREEAHDGKAFVFIDVHGHSRRRGVFAIANGNEGDQLVNCMAARTPLLDAPGTSRTEVRPQDEGVGRVAAARLGYQYSLTLEASLSARHADA